MKRPIVKLEPDWGMDIGLAPMLEISEVRIVDHSASISGIAHSSIKINDTLSYIVQLSLEQDPQEAEGNKIATISLEVQSITAYHTALNRVNAGMDAQITFVGETRPLQQVLNKLGWLTTDGQIYKAPVSTDTRLIITR